jgi:O-succinylbenzoic acid--CoA ligase
MNRRAAVPELAYQIQRVGAAVLVHDDPHAEAAAALAADAGPLVAMPIDAGLARPVPAEGRRPPPDVDVDAPATILFTSGTSGRPKGAILSYANHLASAAAWATILEPRPSDRWLACLPLFHVAGLAVVMRAGRWGVALEVSPRFDAGEVSEAIEAGISHVSLVPTQLQRLLAERGGRPAPSTLRAILLGGGPLGGDLLAQARGAGLPVLTTYGMTETASGVAVGGPHAVSGDDPTALRPLPGMAIRIAPGGDADGISQILVRGPIVFGGYFADAEATSDRLVDGWLQTGDLGTMDDRGLLRVVDRRDDLIVRGGENVYPAEVEAVLVGHPGVVEAAIVGLPDPTWGAVPMAAIVLVPGAKVSDAALERHCRERLAGYKVPVGFHRVVALPRNESGKIFRRELRDELVGHGLALVGDEP